MIVTATLSDHYHDMNQLKAGSKKPFSTIAIAACRGLKMAARGPDMRVVVHMTEASSETSKPISSNLVKYCLIINLDSKRGSRLCGTICE